MKAITTTLHGPTDTRGSRITASDGDGNRITVPYDHAVSLAANHRAACLALCAKLGWHGELVGGHTRPGMAWVWANSIEQAEA